MDATLPILDLSRMQSDPVSFVAELGRVSHEVGFFHLVGHGVDPAHLSEVLEIAAAFFALPEEDKLAIENVHSPQFRGYARLGNELTNGEVDWREQVDIGPEREVVQAGPQVPTRAVLEGPNQWPDALPRFREVFTAHQARMEAIATALLEAWARALESPPDIFAPAFAQPFPLLKVVRYEGVDGPPGQQGVGAHRDGGVLTLLLVEPGKGGLEVEVDGTWREVDPIPGAFIVNIGEMLELATGGYLTATLHRVISPPAGTSRISIPYFHNPGLEATMPVLDLPPELAASARGVSDDPSAMPILQRYGDNVLRYRLRAHPDVAAIHHPELLAAFRA